MNILGLSITRVQKAPPPSLLSSPDSRGGWWPVVRDWFPGAWQRNMEISTTDVLTYSAVWACITLIAGDIAKLWLGLVELDNNGIWMPTENAAFSPVLRKPNPYQTRIKFIYCWMLSKLIHGNTYVLKVRDNRQVVVAMYILDPTRVRVLVATDGSVYYQLSHDNLSRVREDVVVPASEIIHDLNVPLYHPLVGVSPIHACGLAAMQGLKIQHNSEQFFANHSQPGGVLTAPGVISESTAKRIQEHWESNFSGQNVGRVAVLGDGLKYEAMSVNAHDAQLIEQLKWTAETVCSCFHVPPYKIGLGALPSYNNVQALNTEYYGQALQEPIESLEACLDEGLGLTQKINGKQFGVEFDLDALLRMDSASQMDMATKGVIGGILKPNEARADLGLPPVDGGNTPYLQQQNYSLAALNKRDSQDDPFETKARTTTRAERIEDEDDDELIAAEFSELLRKELVA